MNGSSRRQFLKRSGCITAAGLAASILPRSAWAYPLGLPPGLQLYTVSSDIQKDAPAALHQVAAIGYRAVETAGFGSLKTAPAFRKALDEAGLKCPSAHLGFDLANLQKTFDDANALGCTYATCSVPWMMILPRPLPAAANLSPADQKAAMARAQQQLMSPMTPDQFKRMAEALNHVGAEAKKNGLKYASHNHWMEFTLMNGKPGYDYLLTHTDPALVNFELDCGWVTVSGYSAVHYLDTYAGRFKMLHMSDYLPLTTRPPFAQIPPGAELGRGIVPYKAILAAAQGKGIQHVFVEQAGPFPRMPQMEAAKVDFAYLKSF